LLARFDRLCQLCLSDMLGFAQKGYFLSYFPFGFSPIEVNSEFPIFHLPLNMRIKVAFHFLSSVHCFILCLAVIISFMGAFRVFFK
jgi:hypothetical protein